MWANLSALPRAAEALTLGGSHVLTAGTEEKCGCFQQVDICVFISKDGCKRVVKETRTSGTLDPPLDRMRSTLPTPLSVLLMSSQA